MVGIADLLGKDEVLFHPLVELIAVRGLVAFPLERFLDLVIQGVPASQESAQLRFGQLSVAVLQNRTDDDLFDDGTVVILELAQQLIGQGLRGFCPLGLFQLIQLGSQMPDGERFAQLVAVEEILDLAQGTVAVALFLLPVGQIGGEGIVGVDLLQVADPLPGESAQPVQAISPAITRPLISSRQAYSSSVTLPIIFL